jgi:alpha-glucoside transport system substrate-binding protein
MRPGPRFRATVALGAVAVLTAGCASEDVGATGGDSSSRTTIEVMYSLTGEQEAGFQNEVDVWAEENDVEVTFSQTSSFNELIITRAQGNDAPDVALFPQPRIMREMADQNLLADLSDIVDQGDLDLMIDDALETGAVGGTQFAIPTSIDIKSLVFYPKLPFETAGYEVPETYDDLVTLSEEIADSGASPWCFGTDSEEATGWPATDWVENLMLIIHGGDVYKAWVAHEIAFDDDRVVEALDQMEQLLLAEGRTNGGRQSIAENDYDTVARPMFDTPPSCFLHRQGSAVAEEGGFPESVLADLDSTVGVFPMPGPTAEDRPVLGGGELAGLFSKGNRYAEDLVRFLASSEYGTNGYAETGAWISARTDFDTDLYPTETLRSIARIGYESTEFVYDGSDQMPVEVGSGSFRREMVAWIRNEQDLQTTLDNIENSWPD